MALLEIRNLCRRFGGLSAVDDLSMNITQGDIHGLIGPNGAGKSTLFDVVSGFLKPTSGQVIFKGEDITGLKPSATAKKGLVRTFQLTTLFTTYTVLQNVSVAFHVHSGVGLVGALLNGRSTRRKEEDIRKKTAKILEFLDIAHLSDELATNLPHGHQRTLGIAVAMATEPELLMLDEPATGMNPEETSSLMDTIKKIRDRGITILLVEHNMQAVMQLCDRITAISFGRKLAEGSPEEVRENESVIEAYLGAEEVAP